MSRLLGFPKFGYMGRMGNQMFELASAYGMAKKSGRQLALPEWRFSQCFEGKVDIIERGPLYGEVKELGFGYCGDYMIQKLSSASPIINISGYFQSEKYFEHCREDVRQFFRWKHSFADKIIDKNYHLLGGTAIHVRRGDYVNNQGYVELPLEYYFSSLEMIKNRGKVLIFSDDINWCRRHFSILPYDIYFMEGNTDVEDMLLMSCCKNFVIANSSFSWWGAWLGENNGGKIIHPGVLFSGNMKDYDIKNYFPERWTENKKWVEN